MALNSTSSNPERFDLVSECSRFSPILRPADDDFVGFDGKDNGRTTSWSDGRHRKSMHQRAVDVAPANQASVEDGGSMHEIPIWICGEPRFISGISCATTCREIIQALIDDELNGAHETDDDDEDVYGRRGTGDASQQVANGQYDDCDDDDGARRRSHCHTGRRRRDGVHQSNECSVNIGRTKDFAAASRDLNDYVITERWRDVEQALAGDTRILPIWTAWGSARNEVRFKLKINKSKDGRRHHNDLLTVPLKKDHKSKERKRQTFKTLTNMMRRLVQQSESIQRHIANLNAKPKTFTRASSAIDLKHLLPTKTTGKSMLMQQFLENASHGNAIESPEPRALENIFVNRPHDGRPLEPINLQSTDDELFLLIDDKQSNAEPKGSDYLSDDQDSGVHVEYRQYVLNKKINDNLSARLMKLAETPKRKLRTKNDFDRLRARSLNKAGVAPNRPHSMYAQPTVQTVRQPMRSTTNLLAESRQQSAGGGERRDAIRIEIATRMVEMNHLLQYERDIEEALRNRGDQYRAQNKRYTYVNGIDTSVERIQAKLDAYAQEIVSNEFELFKIKLEITQKCGILHNLMRMLSMERSAEEAVQAQQSGRRIERDVNARIREEHEKRLQANHVSSVRTEDQNEQFVDLTFVDNIYEFCDNNRSIVV